MLLLARNMLLEATTSNMLLVARKFRNMLLVRATCCAGVIINAALGGQLDEMIMLLRSFDSLYCVYVVFCFCGFVILSSRLCCKGSCMYD